MENQILTGIGCFAGPERLGRIFKRIVQTYTLGKFDSLEWDQGSESDGSEGIKLLKALIAGPAVNTMTVVTIKKVELITIAEPVAPESRLIA